MGKTYKILAIIILLKVFQSFLCVHGNELIESLCEKHEQEALLKFKQRFTRDPMSRLSSWVGEDCCQWVGVSCDNLTHHVVKLSLRTSSLSRPYDGLTCLPDPQVSMVSSGVSSALLQLKFLTHLDLSGNDFSGSRIPEFLGSLRNLRYLNLSLAGFSGAIPSKVGNLTNLVHLDLRTSECSELNVLYVNSFGWVSGLVKLRSLDMSGCYMPQADRDDTFKVLSTLSSLLVLSLSNCDLSNSHLSQDLISINTSNKSYFSTLRYLNLRWNNLEGLVPHVISKMFSLRFLSLGDNDFNGSVPPWLRALCHLEVLDLNGNNFTYVEGGIMGIIGGNPCGFKHLDLSLNTISQGDVLGHFTSLSGCGAFELGYLDLGGNAMNGSLSSLLGQLTNLYHLDLSSNKFKGRVPESFVKLSALRYLDLSYNQLSGLIPDFIGHLTQIEVIDMSSNSLQGTVSGIGNLSKLSYLDMNYNSLILNLDSSINWQPPFQLELFNVHSCLINAVFPQWLRNQTQIAYLDLSYTGLSGEFPTWLWNSSNFVRLHLSNNKLTGSLPQHIVCAGPYGCRLQWLDLSNNLLYGSIPKWLGHLETIYVIDLSSNLLSGALFDANNNSSPSLFNTGNFLQILDLSDNMLIGKIQFGTTYPSAYLELLSLRGNRLNGPIPSQLCDFVSLMVLELAENRFTGRIPRCLGSIGFENTGVIISDTNLKIKEIVKGIVEMSTGTKGGQTIIDLSSNRLTGTIPKELANISTLFEFNLSYNHLTGHIPENIGNMKELESLDLSNNCLSGTIPQSLSTIKWLSKLNLSNNNLHGPIPTGTQLQTLDDPSIYAGNSGLYGCPLPKNCTPHDSPPSYTNSTNPTANDDNDVEKEDKYAKLWLILAVMSGVATGFWGVVVTLMVKKNWRHTYFRYVEDLGDRIYVAIKVSMNRFKRRFR